jgi:membrane complex biogenesis BtpA family protein
MGLWNTNAGALLRERRRINADSIAIFRNVVPEFASQVGNRNVTEIAHSAAVSSLADAILVSGPMAGVGPELNTIEEAKEGVGEKVPVLTNTGSKSTNISAILKVCDGVIVGSDLKRDGYTWNEVDPERVKEFMKAAGR